MMNEQTIREYAALMKELGLTAIEVDESRELFSSRVRQGTTGDHRSASGERADGPSGISAGGDECEL